MVRKIKPTEYLELLANKRGGGIFIFVRLAGHNSFLCFDRLGLLASYDSQIVFRNAHEILTREQASKRLDGFLPSEEEILLEYNKRKAK